MATFALSEPVFLVLLSLAEELRAAFNPSNGWDIAAIEPDRIQTRYHDDGAPAWFATIKRI